MTEPTPPVPTAAITKRTLKWLEKLFLAEINGLLPFQSKSEMMGRLVNAGYIEPMSRVFGGSFSVTCKGYRLTEKGRYEYCKNC